MERLCVLDVDVYPSDGKQLGIYENIKPYFVGLKYFFEILMKESRVEEMKSIS